MAPQLSHAKLLRIRREREKKKCINVQIAFIKPWHTASSLVVKYLCSSLQSSFLQPPKTEFDRFYGLLRSYYLFFLNSNKLLLDIVQHSRALMTWERGHIWHAFNVLHVYMTENKPETQTSLCIQDGNLHCVSQFNRSFHWFKKKLPAFFPKSKNMWQWKTIYLYIQTLP